MPGVIESLEALGALALDLESAEEATRLLAAADVAAREVGLARWPIAQPAHDATLEHARAVLGDDAFAVAWAEGVVLSIDDAVAYASRARGERKRPSSGWAGLTPTEVRVVALAAEGLTNRQIAERMFVAPGTVKVHLGHVFTKLGVTTRAELAAAATKRSLTSRT